MTASPDVPCGRYRHYKGNEYTVLSVARHSETLEELVVYRQEYGDHGLWVRPKSMFLETVEVDGKVVPRFLSLEPKAAGGRAPDTNLFADLERILPEEVSQTINAAAGVRIERIVSHGHVSPAGFWYDQVQHEWVVVLKGAARIRFEGEDPIDLGPGDYINIPSHRRHRVDWTTPSGPTLWLAVHYGQADTTP